MSHIELASPTLRDSWAECHGFPYRVLSRRYLPTPETLPVTSLVDVIESRRSRRDFGLLDEDELGTLLWIAARTRGTRTDPSGRRYQIRAAPSAGGLHPVDLIVIEGVRSSPRVHLYDPLAHALCELHIADQQQLESLLKFVNDILPAGEGVLMWFVAQFERTLAKYVNGESLVWRDAGSLLALIYLAAEAMGLSCCAIGPTGEPEISKALGGDDRLRGVGGCLIGRRASSDRAV